MLYNARRSQYTAVAGETDFPFEFRVVNDDELLVVKSVGDAETPLTLDVDYQIFGLGEPTGGFIRLKTGAIADDVYTLDGDTTISRRSDYDPSQTPSGDQLDKDLDRLLDIASELRRDVAEFGDELARMLQIPAGSNVTAEQLISEITRLGQIYMGSRETDPATRRDGSALRDDDFYFNRLAGEVRYWRAGAFTSGMLPNTSPENLFASNPVLGTTGGTVNAITSGFSPQLAAGDRIFTTLSAGPNTLTNVTHAVDGTAAVAVKLLDGSNPQVGDTGAAGTPLFWLRSGSDLYLLNPVSADYRRAGGLATLASPRVRVSGVLNQTIPVTETDATYTWDSPTGAVTVTLAAHGYRVGQRASFRSVTGVAQTIGGIITAVTTDTFTFITADPGQDYAGAGKVRTLNNNASNRFGVHSIVDGGVGISFTVNFIDDLPPNALLFAGSGLDASVQLAVQPTAQYASIVCRDLAGAIVTNNARVSFAFSW